MSMAENLVIHPANLVQAQGIRFSGVTGLLTTVAADGDLFGMRNILKACAVARVRMRWVTRTAFGAAQSVAFRANKVTGFTVLHDTGGVAVRGHYKRGSQVPGLAVGGKVPNADIAAYIADTGAITGATYTAPTATEPDAFAVGDGGLLPSAQEDDGSPDGLCFCLEPDEGIVVKNQILMGAAGVGNLYVSVDLFRL